MIKFHELFIQNFLSVSNVTLDLANQGLVLIEGINKDDPSAKSNGSGKSSIVDAISWCLFGVTARGGTGDSVINVQAGKDTQVCLIVEIDGVKYRVRRGRKHHEYKSRVFFDQLAPYNSLTLGTDKLTQHRINQMLGCTPDIFNASIYMGQERMPDLPNMTDKALKAILEEALSLDKLDDALEVCKGRLAGATYDENLYRGHADRCEARIESQRAIMALHITNEMTASNNLKDAEKKKADYIKLHKTEMEELEVELGRLYARSATCPPAKSYGEMRKLVAAHQQPMMDKIEAIKVRIAEIGEDIRSTKIKCDQAVTTRRALLDGGANCPTCGQTTADPAHLTAELAKQQAIIDGCDDAMSTKREGLSKLSTKYNAANALILTEGDKMMEALREEQVLADRIAADIKAVETGIKAKKDGSDRMITSLNLAIATATSALADCTSGITIAQSQIEMEQDDYLRHQTNAQQAADLVATLEKVKMVLGRKGFRGEVLDQVTPFLNTRTDHYLTQLTDGNISAEWSTISQNSSGDYTETFHIDVAHKSGVKEFALLSGGEKRKVRLATALALQDLVGTRAVKPIKLFVADEIDDAIDGAGLELLMGLLEEKARDVGTVFVISHNDIGDYCRNKITVVKQDGQSTFVKP